ncbi:DoxX family protein [Streptomyces mirabilis]|uniref:DoxX family protein n=1 Tax=Streptomyces mirabilis TaxID=68239 RepID=UPI0036DD975A
MSARVASSVSRVFIACAIVAALMSAVLLASASAEFTRPKRFVDQMSTVGPYYGVLPFLGVARIAGAGGRIVGLWWPLGNRRRRRTDALLHRRGRRTPACRRLQGRAPGSRPRDRRRRPHRVARRPLRLPADT